MIDAAAKALEEKTIDNYAVTVEGPNYVVSVSSGKSDAEGRGETEEKAYQAAMRQLKKS